MENKVASDKSGAAGYDNCHNLTSFFHDPCSSTDIEQFTLFSLLLQYTTFILHFKDSVL